MTTAVPRETFWPQHQDRKGWLPREIRSNETSYTLSAAEVRALWQCLNAIPRSFAIQDVRSHHFAQPKLIRTFKRLAHGLRYGPGFLVLSGLPVMQCSPWELRILCWGIGTFFGVGESQTTDGNLLCEVLASQTDLGYRAFTASGALPLHCDRADIVGLMCVRAAASGGANRLISLLAIREQLRIEEPETLHILERGFFINRGVEQAIGDPEVTRHRVPIFSRYDGLVSGYIGGNASLIHQAHFLEQVLSDAERSALDRLQTLLNESARHHSVKLSSGDMLFLNNYEVAHGRDDFVDSADATQRRFLLRLWLSGNPPRPKPASMQVIRNPSGRQGVDPHCTYI